MSFNDEIVYGCNKYFLNHKNIYDFLFVTTEKQYKIYELKNFSFKKNYSSKIFIIFYYLKYQIKFVLLFLMMEKLL